MLDMARYFLLADLSQDILTLDKDIGCDACNWFFTIWSGVLHPIRFYANDRVPRGTRATRWAFDFTCNYDPLDWRRAALCKSTVDLRVRSWLNDAARKLGDPLHHYYNTPSCHDLPNERPFQERSYFSPARIRLIIYQVEFILVKITLNCHR